MNAAKGTQALGGRAAQTSLGVSRHEEGRDVLSVATCLTDVWISSFNLGTNQRKEN